MVGELGWWSYHCPVEPLLACRKATLMRGEDHVAKSMGRGQLVLLICRREVRIPN